MERKKNDGIFPIRFVALMLAVFVGVMGLPILMTAMNGGLDLPVEYSYRAREFCQRRKSGGRSLGQGGSAGLRKEQKRQQRK